MARTIIEIERKHTIDDTLETMMGIFSRHGYQNKIVKGENVWTKGDGVIAPLECFEYSFTDSGITLQGWIRDAILGEMALEGFYVWVIKRKMRSVMDEIVQSI